MKTNNKNTKKGLQARPDQQITKPTAPEQSGARAEALRVDFAKRQANRELPTERVIELLKSALPIAYERAEVVGQVGRRAQKD